MTAWPPGSTLGILGGGQLGRMLAAAAAQLGYRTVVYSPEEEPVAAQLANAHVRGGWDDGQALARFAAACDVATFEWENVPLATLDALAPLVEVRPGRASLARTQDRADEKRFVNADGARTAEWAMVDGPADIRACRHWPAVLKTRTLGYDGRGQARLDGPEDAEAAWAAIGARAAVIEARVDFDAEFSVILARSADGGAALWDVPVNSHADGVLSRSVVPAPAALGEQIAAARGQAVALAHALGHVGVMAVEFFACEGGPLVNEIAPRVHNSGHWTIEGAVTSQFENHVRAVLGLPLGSTELVGAGAVMDNLLGAAADGWKALLADPAAHLHLYGKDEARPGRKMGHVTRVGAGSSSPSSMGRGTAGEAGGGGAWPKVEP